MGFQFYYSINYGGATVLLRNVQGCGTPIQLFSLRDCVLLRDMPKRALAFAQS